MGFYLPFLPVFLYLLVCWLEAGEIHCFIMSRNSRNGSSLSTKNCFGTQYWAKYVSYRPLVVPCLGSDFFRACVSSSIRFNKVYGMIHCEVVKTFLI